MQQAHADSYLMSQLANLPEYSSGNNGGVTLYGSVDLGGLYTKADNAPSNFQMQSGGMYTSKFGLYGQEDLGGGLKAEFKLESGFLANTGAMQASALFNRESWVGLKSSEWGTVRFGNQINAMLPLFIDPFGLVTTNSVYGWVGGGVVQSSRGAGYNTDLGVGASSLLTRVPNAITYATPRVGGVDGQLIYATNTTGANNPRVASQGGVISYLTAPFYFAASYNQVWSAPVALTPDAAPEGIRTDIPAIGVIYDNGKLVLSASYTLMAPKVAQDGIARITTLGAILPLGRFTYRASAIYRDTSDVRDSTGKEVHDAALGIMLGSDYAFSKRTTLYARLGEVRNYGASTIILNSTPLPFEAGTFNPQTGITTKSLAVGMNHSF
ncbi:porin [Glaciimonas soli]|uniref:Porin n=1 Tax=Glaciimonas soli TaxID=2590999 RepID=A0A843YLK1_9BURK|nr:porin [Glaciimonas soli]MQR00749.1 porin [Glaciimonas soli]